MKKTPDYCHYLAYDDKKQKNICTCYNWLWFHCQNDCVRMGDIKNDAAERLIAESDPKAVKRLEELLARMKNEILGLSGGEKEKIEEAIKRVEYDISRYRHEVPWLPKYREGING